MFALIFAVLLLSFQATAATFDDELYSYMMGTANTKGAFRQTIHKYDIADGVAETLVQNLLHNISTLRGSYGETKAQTIRNKLNAKLEEKSAGKETSCSKAIEEIVTKNTQMQSKLNENINATLIQWLRQYVKMNAYIIKSRDTYVNYERRIRKCADNVAVTRVKKVSPCSLSPYRHAQGKVGQVLQNLDDEIVDLQTTTRELLVKLHENIKDLVEFYDNSAALDDSVTKSCA